MFFPTFFSQPWLSPQNKARLLEWKGRLDLAMYASRRSPKLLIDEIKNYEAKRSWKEVFDTCIEEEGGDGHVSKMARTLANGEHVCKPFEGQENFRLKGNMWLKLGNMREYPYIPQFLYFLSFPVADANIVYPRPSLRQYDQLPKRPGDLGSLCGL